MPSSQPTIIYWDSCVFLEYINAEDALKVSHIQGLMSDDSVKIVTSVFSIVEVAKGKVEQDQNTLDPAIEAQINSLWEIGSPIELIEFYEMIAEDARNLIRKATENKHSLKPGDAIQLATANRIKASAFHTYDGKLSKFEPYLSSGLKISEPISNQATLIIPPNTP